MDHTAEPGPAAPRTDGMLRLGAGALALGLGVFVYVFQNYLSLNVRAGFGIVAFIAVVAAFSSNLRAVNWRTVGFGMAIQFALALLILELEFNGWKPGYVFFSKIGNGVRRRLLKDTANDTGCGLKVFRREAFLRLPYFDHLHRFLPALMLSISFIRLSICGISSWLG